MPAADEVRRVETLRRYAILDTLPEQALDDLTALAAQICGTPIALISLVDDERQWFKAKVGLEVSETPREISFCAHAMHEQDIFVVPDATLDPRFADSPLVTGEAGIRFYAGVPLVSSEGMPLGALCVKDRVPRTLTLDQEQGLRVLARQVMTHLELRRHMRELVESEHRLQIVTDNARVGLVIVDRDRRYVYANTTYAEILNLPSNDIVGRRVPEVLPGIYEEQIRPRLDRAIAGEPMAFEMKLSFTGYDRHYAVRYEPTHKKGDLALVVVVVITEITERKQAEAASNRLAAIVEFSDDAIIGKDLGSIVTSWNKGAEKVFGYTAAEMVGSSIMKLIPAGREREELFILEKIGRGESVQHFETLRKTKDGRVINISVTASPIKDREGRIVGVSKVARDVTERRQTEEKLRASEASYRALFEYAPDGIVIVDFKGFYLDANPSICRLLGYTHEDFVGLHASDIVAPDEISEINPALSEIKTGADYHREWRFRRKDGSIVETDVIATKMPEGNLLAVIRDITDRKRAQERIAEQADFLDKARDAILVRDLEGGVLFWNEGAHRMYGWSVEEVVGRNAGRMLYAQPSKFEALNAQTIRDGEWTGELQHLTKDRGEITVEARWTLIRDEAGRPKSILAINTDITERKKIEAQFMRAQRMESIGTLAGGVAHDLNNILAPIMMSIELLKSATKEAESREMLANIEISARRGADIVRQVLSFARGLEGKRIEVQPKHLLKDLESIIKDTFPKDIKLGFSIPRDIWTILGDPTQIHQILLNLCVNARDAMPTGGNLAVTVENAVLDAQYATMNIQAKPGKYVLINVTDSGTGIPSEVIDKIFEPFFTTKELNKGTGLGLSTVMAIVKSHGGIVNVYSEPGKGTTFKVYLPAAEGGAGENEPSERQELPRGNGETILVVDDEASILTITTQTLQAFGYKVLSATDGAEAVAVFAQHLGQIAVVLTDMMMPVMDGPATIHALTRIQPGIKVIATSGLNANGSVAKAANLGVKHFLTKPYTAGTLLKTLKTILDEA